MLFGLCGGCGGVGRFSRLLMCCLRNLFSRGGAWLACLMILLVRTFDLDKLFCTPYLISSLIVEDISPK